MTDAAGAQPMPDDGAAPLRDDPHIGPVLFTEPQLARRVAELGATITAEYAGREPLLLCVLRGAAPFVADLARSIDLPVTIDYITASSYGSSTRTSGVIRIGKEAEEDLAGRDVIVVEDIVDTGLTLRFLLKNLRGRNPASLAVCSLLVRSRHTAEEAGVDYVGFEVPDDRFVIGYGLDVAQRYRNLPFVAGYEGPHR